MSIGVASPPPSQTAMLEGVAVDSFWRITVEQYHQMIQAGILTADDPVELLDGWLVRKMTKNPPHTLATQLLRDALPPLLPAGWFMNDQEPIETDASEPEPDASIVRGTRRQFGGRKPSPLDVALVIEVADSSLHSDRGAKQRIYAQAAIAVYWIVNLVDRQIEVYTDPSGAGAQPEYRQQQNYGPADVVPVVLDGREVARLPVQDILP